MGGFRRCSAVPFPVWHTLTLRNIYPGYMSNPFANVFSKCTLSPSMPIDITRLHEISRRKNGFRLDRIGTPQFAFRTDYDTVVAHLRKAWVPYLYLSVKSTKRQLAENAAEVEDNAEHHLTIFLRSVQSRRNLCITSQTKTRPRLDSRGAESADCSAGIHCSAGARPKPGAGRRGSTKK